PGVGAGWLTLGLDPDGDGLQLEGHGAPLLRRRDRHSRRRCDRRVDLHLHPDLRASPLHVGCPVRGAGSASALLMDATATIQQPVAPPEASEDRPTSGAFSARTIGRLLWASGTGKAAIFLFILMLGISLYVILTYPRNFGRTVWSNPIVWADNPKTV